MAFSDFVSFIQIVHCMDCGMWNIYRNGKVFEVTVLAINGDIEACL